MRAWSLYSLSMSHWQDSWWRMFCSFFDNLPPEEQAHPSEATWRAWDRHRLAWHRKWERVEGKLERRQRRLAWHRHLIRSREARRGRFILYRLGFMIEPWQGYLPTMEPERPHWQHGPIIETVRIYPTRLRRRRPEVVAAKLHAAWKLRQRDRVVRELLQPDLPSPFHSWEGVGGRVVYVEGHVWDSWRQWYLRLQQSHRGRQLLRRIGF